MKKVFLMLFLAAGASVAMAQSQKVIKGSSSFKATLPEFSYGGKAKIFTFEGDLYGDNKQQTITFYSDDFTKQGELTRSVLGKVNIRVDILAIGRWLMRTEGNPTQASLLCILKISTKVAMISEIYISRRPFLIQMTNMNI